jgi:Tfp pilus assembly protein PilE
MARYTILILTVIGLFSIAACQSYTTGLQQSVTRTDETVAITALRNIATAQRNYSVTHEGEYATLAQLAEAGYLDSRFSSARPLKEYVLTLNVSPRSEGSSEGSYTCNADPDAGRQGRHFYIDSASGVIRANETQSASSSDPAIQ